MYDGNWCSCLYLAGNDSTCSGRTLGLNISFVFMLYSLRQNNLAEFSRTTSLFLDNLDIPCDKVNEIHYFSLQFLGKSTFVLVVC